MHPVLLLLLLFAFHSSAGVIDKERLSFKSPQIKPPAGNTSDSLQYITLKDSMRFYTDKNIDSAFVFGAKLIQLCQRPTLKKELTYALQYTGYLYQVRGDYHQSIRYYFKALIAAEKEMQFAKIAGAHRGLAHAYTSLKEYKKADTHCRLGLSALQKEPDTYTHLGILNVQGSIFREQRKLTDALKANMAMYTLAKQQNEGWYEAQGLHAVGWVYNEMGDRLKALDYYQKALLRSEKIGSIDLQCSILLNISETYFRAKQSRLALANCMLAKQRAEKINNSSIIAEANEKLSKIYKSNHQYAKALDAYASFVTLRDSLSQETTAHRIESLQAQYDNVNKTIAYQRQQVRLLDEQNKGQKLAQDRNVLTAGICFVLLAAFLLFWNNRKLQAKNVQINAQRQLLEHAQSQLSDMNRTLETRVTERTEALSKANKELVRKNEEIRYAMFKGQTIERKRVALELHDNLSSLLSAVNMSMQAINPKNLTDPEQNVYNNVRQMLRSAYTEVRNISHNILPAELERDGLVITVSNLMSKINQSSGLQLSMAVESLDVRLPIEIEFNLYSIIFELINNTIRHANATTLCLVLIKTTSGVELTVTDDGVGLDIDTRKRGRGLQNIHTRLESLGGVFELVTPVVRGTCILIKIPVDTPVNGNLAT